MDPKSMPQMFCGEKGPEHGGCYLYSRHFNPTVYALARQLAAMEGLQAGMCTASGMAAVACTLLQLCKSGDHIVTSSTIYGGTHALFSSLLPEMNITTTLVNSTRASAFEKAIRPNTKVIFAETIANPTLRIIDIQAMAEIAHKRGIVLVIDNTFAPMMVTPGFFGADIVIHSITKFINGACDVLAGAVCASQDFIDQLMDLHKGRIMLLGPTMDPRAAFDIIQRLPHLGIRMREHSRRALAVAKLLEKMGVDVAYPGLASHPQHHLAKRMFDNDYGFGGMVTIDGKSQEKAEELIAILQNEQRFGLMAVSLGYYDTLMSCSGTTTSSEIMAEDQEEMGISPGLIRMSVGITGDLKQRLYQLERAVVRVGLASKGMVKTIPSRPATSDNSKSIRALGD
jgi:methionine-gamma-lyase